MKSFVFSESCLAAKVKAKQKKISSCNLIASTDSFETLQKILQTKLRNSL